MGGKRKRERKGKGRMERRGKETGKQKADFSTQNMDKNSRTGIL